MKNDIKYKNLELNKSVQYRTFNARDQINYLKLLEFHSELTNEELYKTLLVPVLKNNVYLSRNEQKVLLINVATDSINDEFDIELTCSCGDCAKKALNIKDLIKFKKTNYKDVTVKNVLFKFAEPDLADINYLSTNSLVEYTYHEFVLSIKSITKNQKEHVMSFEEKLKYIDESDSKMFDELYEEYILMKDDLKLEYTYTCEKCNKEQSVEYESIPDLLWI